MFFRFSRLQCGRLTFTSVIAMTLRKIADLALSGNHPTGSQTMPPKNKPAQSSVAKGKMEPQTEIPTEVQDATVQASAPRKKRVLSRFKINPEFEALLTPLSSEEFELLEKSILEFGLQSPIITGVDGTIYDGHNRFRICEKHRKYAPNKVVDLGDDEAIKRWIIEQQLGRRNLTTYQRVLYSLKYKEQIAAQAKANQQAGVLLKSAKGVNTRQEIAQIAGVSEDTVSKVEFVERHADEETKENFRKGDRSLSINEVYQKINKEHGKKKPAKSKAAPSAPTAKQVTADRQGSVSENTEIATPNEENVVTSDKPEVSTLEEPRDVEWFIKGLLECLVADKTIDLPTRCFCLFQDCFKSMDDNQQIQFVSKFSLFLQKQGYGGDACIDAAAESV